MWLGAALEAAGGSNPTVFTVCVHRVECVSGWTGLLSHHLLSVCSTVAVRQVDLGNTWGLHEERPRLCCVFVC